MLYDYLLLSKKSWLSSHLLFRREVFPNRTLKAHLWDCSNYKKSCYSKNYNRSIEHNCTIREKAATEARQSLHVFKVTIRFHLGSFFPTNTTLIKNRYTEEDFHYPLKFYFLKLWEKAERLTIKTLLSSVTSNAIFIYSNSFFSKADTKHIQLHTHTQMSKPSS